MTKREYEKLIERAARKIAPDTWGIYANDFVSTVYINDQEWWDAVDAGYDEEDTANKIAKAIEELRRRESNEIEEALAELGFGTIGTGGGCEAYFRDFPLRVDALTPEKDPPHFLITNNDCGLPTTWNEEAVLGYYEEGWDDSGETDFFDTIRELVDLLKQGKGHPAWAEPEEGTKPPSSDDVDVINRHRRALGMKPIDLSAGWSTKELHEMAENIRTSGRTHNPALERLKRKLMR